MREVSAGVAERRQEVDAFKGLLILLIILGHNYFFGDYLPRWFSGLYNFHVASFLLLPFIFPLNRVDAGHFRDRLIRALAPQGAFLLIALSAYFVLYVDKNAVAIGDWLGSVVIALVVQNEGVLNAAAGFRHFWFLPAMVTLLCLLYLYDRGSAGTRRLILAGAVVWHIGLGLAPPEFTRLVPWGMPIVGFLLLPGLVVRFLYHWVRWRSALDWLLVLAWGFLFFYSVDNRLLMGLAGDISPPSLLQPGRLLFHDFFLILSFFALMRLAVYLSRFFSAIGRVSLQLFLLAPLLWQVFWMAGGSRASADTPVGKAALVIGSFVLVTALGYALSHWILRSRLSGLLFPRSVDQWREAIGLGARHP